MFYPLSSRDEPFLGSEGSKSSQTTNRQLWFYRTTTVLLLVAFVVYVVLQYTYLKSANNNNPSVIDNQNIFRGKILYPSDPQYEPLVSGNNARWVGTPAYIALPGSPQQVVAMVQEALDKNLRITVQSGGHCYEDFALNNPGGAIIVLNSLSGVYRDPDLNNSYVVEAGIRLGDLYSQLYYEYGVTVPGGTCESVGIGGHVLGGGFGLLARRHGLISDHIVAIELVTVDKNKQASLVFAQANDQDPKKAKLFWAHTGGGGGNFGIVTRFWFRNDLPIYPPIQISREWDFFNLTEGDFINLCNNYGNFWLAHSSDDIYRDMYASLVVTETPRMIAVLVSLYVNNTNLIDQYYLALTENVSAIPGLTLAKVGNFTPLIEGEGRPEASSGNFYQSSPGNRKLFASYPNLDEEWTRRGEQKSAYMKKPFTQEQVETIWSWSNLERNNTESPIMAVTAWGGQVNDIPPAATAVIQRNSIFKIQYQTYWYDPLEDQTRVDFLQTFYAEMYQRYEGNVPAWGDDFEGCYVNYPDILLANWSYLYYGEHYNVLKEIDQEWDPLGLFFHSQSIGRQ